MALVLRKIKRNRWYNKRFQWLNGDEIAADPLGDLYTDEGKLSVWLVDDDKSNLNEALVAIACCCQQPSNIDYVLFKDSVLSQLGIQVEECPRDTPFTRVKELHRDLTELSANKLVELAKAILTGESQFGRLPEKDAGRLLAQTISRGLLDRTALNRCWQSKVAEIERELSIRPSGAI